MNADNLNPSCRLTSDERSITAAEAYEQIARLARDHALVHQAAGGVIVVVHPDTQREQGIYEMCQYMAGKGPHPATERMRPDQGK